MNSVIWLVGLSSLLILTSQAGCAVYAETNQCSHCLQGYYLRTNYTCGQCPLGCSQCIAANLCISCASGYFLNQQLCISGPSHCVDVNSFGVCS